MGTYVRSWPRGQAMTAPNRISSIRNCVKTHNLVGGHTAEEMWRYALQFSLCPLTQNFIVSESVLCK